MRYLKTFLISLIFVAFASAKSFAEVKFGISAALTDIDATGTETQEGDSEKTNGSADNLVIIPSIFAEYDLGGITVGLDYIPLEADISKNTRSRQEPDGSSDVGSEADTGTNKAQAELENHLTLYTEIPVAGVIAKAGYVMVDVNTLESLDTGSTYGNDSVEGYLIGVGFESGNYKVFLEYVDYDTVSVSSSTGNKIEADIDTTNIRVAYTF